MHAFSPSPRPQSRRRSLLRALGLACLIGLCVIVVLPYAASHFVGQQRLKALAEQTLGDALGRQVTIAGDVAFSLAPWPALRMESVTVADTPPFGDAPLLEAGRLETTIRLLPLLSRIVAPGSVRVRDLRLHLRRDASGHGNWEALRRPRAQAATDTPDWHVMPEPRDVLLENAQADYHDAATGRTLAVSGIRLATGVGQPFTFSLDFTAHDTPRDASLDCHVRGEASIDTASGQVALHRTRIESILTRQQPLVAGGAVPARAKLHADLDYEDGVWTLSHIDLNLLAARLAGAMRLTGLPEAPKASASLTLSAPIDGHWRELLGLAPADDNLVTAAPPDPGRDEPLPPPEETVLRPDADAAPGRIEAALDLTVDASGVDVSSLRLHLPQGAATASGVWRFGAKPLVDAAISLTGMDLAALPLPAGRAGWPWPTPWPADLNADVRLDLRHCALGALAVPDAHATLSARDGRFRLYPVSAVLPGGIVALDARLAPDQQQDGKGLAIEARAALEPGSGQGTRGLRVPTTVEIKGTLFADGARGAFTLRSDNPQAAATLLGQTSDLPVTALDAKGSFSISPGVGRLVARAALTDLQAAYAGMILRGQAGWDAKASDKLTFDLDLDSLDLDHLPTLPFGGTDGEGLRADGKLHLGRLAAHGLEARNLGLGILYDRKRLDVAVTGGELFGGKLGGKGTGDTATGHVSANLQLTGAEAARLPGLGEHSGLAGQLTAKATLEAAAWTKGRPQGLLLALEAESSQLTLKTGGKRQNLLSGPKAALTLKSRDGADTGDGFDLDANLTASAAAVTGLREVRLTATGPVALDKTLHPRGPSQYTVHAAALSPGAGQTRDVRLAATGPISLDWAGGLTLGELAVNAGALTATAKLWRKAGEPGPMAFSLETQNAAPRPVLASWGLTVPASVPADKLAKATLTASGTVGEDALDIKHLNLRCDDAVFTGHGSLPQFDLKRSKWTVAVDRLDLDAYFPPPQGTTPPAAQAPGKPFDLDLLRQLAMEIHISAGWLKRGNVAFDAATIMSNAKGGLFTFRLESPRFYGGRFFAEVRGDARESTLRTIVELKLESFECARFLKDWADGDTLASGSATFILAARTNGLTEKELRGHIAGNASLQITRGALKVKARAPKAGEPAPEDHIPFDIFSSTWNSHDGVARSDDFRIDGPRMRVAGNGFVDLRDESINLSLVAYLKEGSEVPATIIGPLDNPKLTIDRSRIFGDILYNVLQGIVSIPGKAITRILMLR